MGLNHPYLRHILDTNAIHLAGYGWLDGGRLGIYANGLESLTEGRPYGIISSFQTCHGRCISHSTNQLMFHDSRPNFLTGSQLLRDGG